MRGNDGAGAEHGEDVLRISRQCTSSRAPGGRRASERRIAEAAVVLERHPGKRPLFLEAAARKQPRHLGVTVGDVDQHRPETAASADSSSRSAVAVSAATTGPM